MPTLLALGVIAAMIMIGALASRRGRRFVREIVAPKDEPLDPDEPVAIMRNLHETEAEMMCERLKSEGIPSFIRGLRTETFWRPINVELCVASRDAGRALAILSPAGEQTD
jgi:hypothetical protein